MVGIGVVKAHNLARGKVLFEGRRQAHSKSAEYQDAFHALWTTAAVAVPLFRL